MNVIDHRILIPRPPDRVWQYISDISNNPNWQVNCKQVAFLTSRRNGVGMRWRVKTTSGREWVMETTAWYEGLGYEYTCVDSAALAYNRGRIRLQEIAEGTIVQWTYSFETKGLLAGVRTALGARQRIEAEMVDSLRKLWRVLNQTSGVEASREVKSLMREAPDYEARARYKSRHPTVKEADESSDASTKAVEVSPARAVIVEPPLADEDTRPSTPVSAMSEVRTQPAPALANPPSSSATAEVVEAGQFDSPSELETAVNIPSASVTPATAQSNSEVEVPATAAKASDEVSSAVVSSAAPEPMPAVVQPAAAESTPSSAVTSPERSNVDTREISVFELFGIPRPSQTQQMAAVTLPEAAFPPAATPVETPSTTTAASPVPKRVGLRLMQRHRAASVRRPI